MFRRPPRAVFHLALVPVTLVLLYAASFPGAAFLPFAAATFALLGAAAVWAVRAVAYGVARRNGTASGSARWFAVAPLAALVVTGLVAGAVPLRVRWAAARPDFERLRQSLTPPRRGALPLVLQEETLRLGTYDIRSFDRLAGGRIVFHEETGNLFDDAGFAYLPDGPSDDLEAPGFESPRWRSLGGGWYAWTASW